MRSEQFDYRGFHHVLDKFPHAVANIPQIGRKGFNHEIGFDCTFFEHAVGFLNFSVGFLKFAIGFGKKAQDVIKGRGRAGG